MFLCFTLCSFVRLLLRAGVQRTLDPSAETFMSVQCASPETGGISRCVRCMCALCIGVEEGLGRREQLVLCFTYSNFYALLTLDK